MTDKQRQLETLQIMQETLRAIVITITALHPDSAEEIASMLGTFAKHERLHPISRKMLEDLARGPSVIASGLVPHAAEAVPDIRQ